MRELYYKVLRFCFFVFLVGNVTAQTCSSGFGVSAASTPLVCQANGRAIATLGGDLTNINSIQCGQATLPASTVVNHQKNNVLTNIPSGT